MKKILFFTVFILRTAFSFCEEHILVREIISSMSDAELAAQVLMTGIDGNVHLQPGMKRLLQEIPAGAVMLFKYNLTGGTATIKKLLEETSSYIKESGKDIAPFIAVDHEGGLVHRFTNGVTRLPAARTYWENAEAGNRELVWETIHADAFSSGKELASLGINMNLAPVAEIENDENVFFLDTRSYGPDAGFTAAAVSSFADGMMRAGVLPVLKHFPGSSSTDPHTGVAVMEQNREELDAMVMPFKRAIQNGNARALMLSHSIVPAWDANKNGSLSKTLIQDWLRNDLGFNGIIIADDFSMMAVTNRGISSEEAIIEALNAGVNLVMVWPKNLKKTFEAMTAALENGTLSRETLASSVEKILLEKIHLGVIPVETIN